jgi:hypothetical protein
LEGIILTTKTYKPVLVQSSIGPILKYSFKTEQELQDFFLQSLATFQKNNVKTKAIGKSLFVFRKLNQEDENVDEQTRTQ